MIPKRTIDIIGAGPAGLMAAEHLASAGYDVHIYDAMPSVGRKLLMAGRSGLNLTHAEALETFLKRYGAARAYLEPSIRAFPPTALQEWAENLGQPCFTGSSGRIFPKALKASPLLRAWLSRLNTLGATLHTRHHFTHFSEQGNHFSTLHGEIITTPSATLLALGGASWSRLGSNGAWVSLFPGLTTAFAPSNCGFIPSWPAEFRQRHNGSILHGIALKHNQQIRRGDLTVTERGLEGSALYSLTPNLRDDLISKGRAEVTLDLRPTLTLQQIEQRLTAQRPRESLSNRLRKALALDSISRELVRDATPKNASPHQLAVAIKALPLTLTGTDALDRAISTAGGLKLTELDSRFMLKAQPGLFAAGEMLDWEAPTGGYLLQACFSTGRMAAQGMIDWLESQDSAIRFSP
ncbi:TIGR03862 family flavoprotein [Neokomagataea tanensis]|uniref:TIGR03862 family flavoprotein n=1 Tax=Neokomagataea tanensis TaxID=661191 RepID=A0A4Y6V5K1_9PROT|nr:MULTISPECIES: TIGR03862 family flavoprotein [Neokomagataea]QDH25339.1 TIGR03862 family flavoprotein [Neokomagataea tanensis]